ncbi:MAG: HAD-IIB family hydrolase [Candidatus Cloacimonadota bacterium]|nr:HAD-IIB family hydrolase [Candidatus Cloacimonadota bacterium]
MANIELVVTDLDKTLLNDKKKVSTKDKVTLENLSKKNIVRIIATGRSLYHFGFAIKDDFPIDYIIFSSGLGVIDWKTKELLIENNLVRNEISEIYNILTEFQINFMIQKKIPDNHHFYYIRYLKKIHDFERRIRLSKNHSEKISSLPKIDTASQFIAIVNRDYPLVDKLFQALQKFQVIRATSPLDHKSIWIEILPKNVSKGHTLIDFAKMKSLNIDNSIGIGNDYNDIDFLDVTKFSYMVNNAPEDLKKKYLTSKSNNDNGFSHAIHKHIQMEE